MNQKVEEALGILQEECAEVIVEVSKIRRFGLDEISYHTGSTHRKTLELEVGDMLALVDILIDQGVLDTVQLEIAKQHKIEKLKKWSKIYE